MIRATFLIFVLLSYLPPSLSQPVIPRLSRSSPEQGRSDRALTYPDSSGQFPLEMGNLWQLRDDYFNDLLESEVVGDTTFPNGETYTIVDGFGAGFGGRYVRQEGSRVLSYYSYDSTEVTIYDFAAEVGDTIGVLGDFMVILDDKRSVEFYGRTLTEWTFCVSFAEWVTVIDSIGLYGVAFEPGVQIYNFQGAIVNGVQYGTITDIIDNRTVPAMIQLSQNYPNPFNPSTTISFSLPRGTEINLTIFNLLGEEVVTLVSGHREAGTHAVRWDATGQPSGVYFYRLQAGDFIETRKLVLVR